MHDFRFLISLYLIIWLNKYDQCGFRKHKTWYMNNLFLSLLEINIMHRSYTNQWIIRLKCKWIKKLIIICSNFKHQKHKKISEKLFFSFFILLLCKKSVEAVNLHCRQLKNEKWKTGLFLRRRLINTKKNIVFL